jgi:anaerobic selenocysteine-containing dehydrogenase
MSDMSVAYTTCPLCEATCGLELTLSGERIVGVRGDTEDVFSHGYICPKGAALRQLDADPDRLRAPLVRRDGVLTPVSWPEASAAVDAGLRRVIDTYGRDAVALYLGNPNVHSFAGGLYAATLRKALGSRNVYTASTLDQMPKHVSCGYLYGNPLAIPVPDIDRTDYLMVLGADPYSSNGSLWTAPDLPGRFAALRKRGGRLVVVDPRRSRTARAADEYLPIRPGTDVFLLLGMASTLFSSGLAAVGPHVSGVSAVEALVAPFTPEVVGPRCGIEPATIRRLAHELAAAPRAAVYGRIGTTTVEHGTVTSWLVDVLNVLTGNLDRPGGAMFPLPAHGRRGTGRGKGFTTGRWHSRVRGLPEVLGELPTATLVDELETPGEGQVRALVTVAGNPALSAPNGDRLGAALSTVDFMVSVDPYLNETTRFAHVILPPAPVSRQPHYDFAFLGLSVRNVVKYSPAPVPAAPGAVDECEILPRLIAIVSGLGPDADLSVLAAAQETSTLQRFCADPSSPVFGTDVASLHALVAGDTREERALDIELRTGPYGDWFGRVPDGLNLARVRNAPHGIDLGPLEPRLPEILRTVSGTVELCPAPIAAAVAGLSTLDDGPEFVLVGRRHLRSNNSWMHNVPALMKGRPRCTVVVNRADATKLGLTDGGRARVTSRVGEVELPVEVTDDIAPGVVSIPHGWGHDAPGTRLTVASGQSGVSVNRLTDDLRLDPLSGTAVLNGVPVWLVPVQEQTMKLKPS